MMRGVIRKGRKAGSSGPEEHSKIKITTKDDRKTG